MIKKIEIFIQKIKVKKLHLSLYYIMHLICVLVASNVPKREKKTQPARVFTLCIVRYKKNSGVGLVFLIFHVFFLSFHSRFGYHHVGIKNVRKIKKR